MGRISPKTTLRLVLLVAIVQLSFNIIGSDARGHRSSASSSSTTTTTDKPSDISTTIAAIVSSTTVAPSNQSTTKSGWANDEIKQICESDPHYEQCCSKVTNDELAGIRPPSDKSCTRGFVRSCCANYPKKRNQRSAYWGKRDRNLTVRPGIDKRVVAQCLKELLIGINTGSNTLPRVCCKIEGSNRLPGNPCNARRAKPWDWLPMDSDY